MDDYLETNRANWDSRVPLHVRGYRLERFRDDPDHLSDVVRFDVLRLGSIADLDVVHLQCHIGSDTVSLARLGARVNGVDFSAPALEAARALAEESGQRIDFVQADVYSATDVLGAERFDLVYTGVGAICWLPDIRRWADTVASLLRPGGRLFLREGHPVLWALDDPRPGGLLVLTCPYFETEGVRFTEPVTYVEHEGTVASPTSSTSTTASARSSPRCSRQASSSRRSRSTTPSRGPPRGRDGTGRGRGVPPARRPRAAPRQLHAPGAQASEANADQRGS